MCTFLFLIILVQPQGPSLSADLLSGLQSGTTSFTLTEMGLIAGGIESKADLEESKAKLEQFLQTLQLGEKQKKQSAAKQMKAIQKMLAKKMKTLEPAATLSDSISSGTYNAVTASMLFHLAAESQGLSDAAWPKDPKPADSFFGNTTSERGKAILAALLLQIGDQRVFDKPELSQRYLKMSYLLDKNTVFEEERLSREWYNRVHKLYGEKALMQGGRLAEAAAVRFPNLAQFGPLCFNFGILLSQASDIPVATKVPLIESLAKHTGEHRATLEETLGNMKYNQAISFYEAKEFSKAWEMAQTIGGDSLGADIKNLKGAILEGLIEQQMTGGQNADEAKAALQKLDPDRFAGFQTRLKQLAVKSSYESGDFETALALAEKQIDTPQGRHNYLAVLQQLTSQMQQKKSFNAALKRLDSINPELVPQDTLSDLRYNTYAAWLDHNQEPMAQFPIYKRMLSDKALNLKENERTSLLDGWGNAYYLLIEKKIADREFKEAQALSQEALKAVPSHKNLLKQKDLIKTIMQRIQ